jgi:hypothetical protein
MHQHFNNRLKQYADHKTGEYQTGFRAGKSSADQIFTVKKTYEYSVEIYMIYDIIDIYLLTAIGFKPGGSSTVHIYTQTIDRTTQITTNLEECGPCPVFASFTLAFALQLRKKHGKKRQSG